MVPKIGLKRRSSSEDNRQEKCEHRLQPPLKPKNREIRLKTSSINLSPGLRDTYIVNAPLAQASTVSKALYTNTQRISAPTNAKTHLPPKLMDDDWLSDFGNNPLACKLRPGRPRECRNELIPGRTREGTPVRRHEQRNLDQLQWGLRGMITVRRYWDYPRGVIIVFFRDILLFLTKHPLKGRRCSASAGNAVVLSAQTRVSMGYQRVSVPGQEEYESRRILAVKILNQRWCKNE